jgi:hypothetical protein
MFLAFDLDKTIVTEDFRLPKQIEKTLKKVRDAGHFVTVITGRARVAAADFLKQLEISEFYAVNHGALVLGKNELVLRHSRIAPQAADSLIGAYIHHPEVEYSFFEGDVFYVKDPDDKRWAWAQTQHRLIERYTSSLGLHADKIVFSANGLLPELHAHVQTQFPGFKTILWENGFLEVTGEDADKGSALKLLSETLGYKQEDTVAFGDGPNDLTMLEWAGRSIAVGRACKEAIAIADEHIAPPEELGVVKWLEENVL